MERTIPREMLIETSECPILEVLEDHEPDE